MTAEVTTNPTLVLEDIKRLIEIAEKYHEGLDMATAAYLDTMHNHGSRAPVWLLPWWPAVEQIKELEKIKKGYGL